MRLVMGKSNCQIYSQTLFLLNHGMYKNVTQMYNSKYFENLKLIYAYYFLCFYASLKLETQFFSSALRH